MLNMVLRAKLPVFDCVSIMNLERMSWWLRFQYLVPRQNCANGKEQSAKRLTDSGPLTTDNKTMDHGLQTTDDSVLSPLCALRLALCCHLSACIGG